jgi:hypothetical protein
MENICTGCNSPCHRGIIYVDNFSNGFTPQEYFSGEEKGDADCLKCTCPECREQQ